MKARSRDNRFDVIVISRAGDEGMSAKGNLESRQTCYWEERRACCFVDMPVAIEPLAVS